MVREEIVDWLESRGLQPEVTDNQDAPSVDLVTDQVSEETGERSISIAKFFGVTEERINNREFQECMNKLMGTEHDDAYYLGKLSELTHITDLGDPKNVSELKYVEAKLIRFILIDPKEISKCFDYIYVDESFCQNGMSTSSIEILGYLLKMNTQSNGNEDYLKN